MLSVEAIWGYIVAKMSYVSIMYESPKRRTAWPSALTATRGLPSALVRIVKCGYFLKNVVSISSSSRRIMRAEWRYCARARGGIGVMAVVVGARVAALKMRLERLIISMGALYNSLQSISRNHHGWRPS